MTTLLAVRQGIAKSLRTVNGIDVYDSVPGTIRGPAVIVALPETLDYRGTFGGGAGYTGVADFRLFVYVPATLNDLAEQNLATFLDVEGSQSLYLAIEADPTLGGVLGAEGCHAMSFRTLGLTEYGNGAGVWYETAVVNCKATMKRSTP